MVDKTVENLKIYQITYQLLKYIFKDTVHYFPREYKYTLGEKIKNILLDTVLKIYEANRKSLTERQPYIEEILTNLKSFEIMIQLSFDLHILPPKKYHYINSQIILLRKMTYGRRKNLFNEKQ